jgi:hypothetical protein
VKMVRDNRRAVADASDGSLTPARAQAHEVLSFSLGANHPDAIEAERRASD